MKDTGNIVSVYSGLLSSLAYAGNSVPVYEDEPIETVPDSYVKITEVTSVPVERNNSSWISEVLVQVEVVTRQYKVSNRLVRDEISEDILQAILPTVAFELNDSDFQITNIELDSSAYLHELDGAYHINRKILVFRNHLIEK